MAQQYTKWERYFHRLNIIFHGIVAISMVPFAFSFLETQKSFPDSPLFGGDEAMMIKFGLIGATLLLLLVAFQFNKKKTTYSSDLPLFDRLRLYEKKHIWFYAIIQCAGITSCLGLYMLKDQFFSFLYVAVLFVFSQIRPAYDQVVKQNKITEEEVEELNELSDA